MIQGRKTEDLTGELMDALIRVIHASMRVENEPVEMKEGVLLYASEVHLIDLAGRYPDENISQIASRLGVTKGAVSQISIKLEKKGYINRVKEEGNLKNISLRLTDTGKMIAEWHRTLHERTNQEMQEFLAGLDAEEISRLISLLTTLEQTLKTSLTRRKEHLKWFLHGDDRK